MVGSSGGGHLCLPELALPPLPIRGPSSPARTAGQPRRTQCLTAFRSPEETHLIWNLMEFSPSKPRPETDLDSGSVVPGPTESMSCQNVTTSVRPGRAPAVPSPGWVVAGSYCARDSVPGTQTVPTEPRTGTRPRRGKPPPVNNHHTWGQISLLWRLSLTRH